MKAIINLLECLFVSFLYCKNFLFIIVMQGAVSLVTGGASGLGKATVERFIQQGSKVILCDLPTSKGNEISKSIGEEKCVFVPVNVSEWFRGNSSNSHSVIFQIISEKDIEHALQVTQEKFGKLNNLVNCAGIGVAFKTYNFNKEVPHSLEDFKKVFEVRLASNI